MGLEPTRPCGQGILSPSCLPIPPLRHLHKKSRTDSGPCGAENETRTRDPDLGKVVLYQLSYFRFASRIGVFVTTRHNQTLFASALAAPRIPLWRLSGKRDSNSRPRPWQGRALPTELFPLANCAAKVQLFLIPQTINGKNLFSYLYLELSPSVESCGCGLGPYPVRLG